ncbi:MAG: hypothetical protein Q7K29_04160, partial [Thermoleophilia bacterium]|nr:hypothetical protein [Thermoleophilia bacterium]
SKPDIFKILGMPPTATAQQVRDAFRKRITATHGDSFQGKIRKAGAIFSPAEREELFKVMEQSTKDLNAAYNAYQGR